MTPPNSTQTAEIHGEYVRLTGMPLTLDYLKEQMWHVWGRYRKQEPFTVADLSLVVAYLKAQIKKGERKPGCLKFSNLIASPDYFEEDLQLARAWARKPRADAGRAQALRSTHRPTDAPSRPVKSAGDLLRESQFVKEHMAKWRAELL